MLAKVLMATLTAGLAFMVARQIKQRSDKAKAQVKTRQKETAESIVTLREDPQTGVFHPSDPE